MQHLFLRRLQQQFLYKLFNWIGNTSASEQWINEQVLEGMIYNKISLGSSILGVYFIYFPRERIYSSQTDNVVATSKEAE